MSNVKSIKQKAIEIANNSLSKILIGVMNQQNEPVGVSSYGEMDEFLGFNIDFENDDCVPQVVRISPRREERNEIRRRRRLERLNK